MAPGPVTSWETDGEAVGTPADFILEVEVEALSHVRLLATPWTVAHQAPPSMGFSRQEYWRGLPFPSPIVHRGGR